MVGKLLSTVTVSLAALAPVQFASAQDSVPFAEAAVYSQDSNWFKATVSPGTTYFYLTGLGDDIAQLDLFIYNQAGKLLASHTGPGDEATVRLLSKQAQMVAVEVRNVGKIDAKYELDIASRTR